MWGKVGSFLKEFGGDGASIVGSLLMGNVQGAISKGVAMVQEATGKDDPDEAMNVLKNDPQSIVRLKEIALEEKINLREHLAKTKEMELRDKQSSHSETQKTIRAGDQIPGASKWVRPVHATISLLALIYYALTSPTPSLEVLVILSALPLAYSGLRTLDKNTFAKTISGNKV